MTPTRYRVGSQGLRDGEAEAKRVNHSVGTRHPDEVELNMARLAGKAISDDEMADDPSLLTTYVDAFRVGYDSESHDIGRRAYA